MFMTGLRRESAGRACGRAGRHGAQMSWVMTWYFFSRIGPSGRERMRCNRHVALGSRWTGLADNRGTADEAAGARHGDGSAIARANGRSGF
ncbi:hypothetical protein DN604_16615 [Aeromonas caviae]|nr:hypothetical protein DN604_16615 [Aeromonas caviae]